MKPKLCVNYLKRQYKLQHLFCGGLYNQLKCNKCAVPLSLVGCGESGLQTKLSFLVQIKFITEDSE